MTRRCGPIQWLRRRWKDTCRQYKHPVTRVLIMVLSIVGWLLSTIWFLMMYLAFTAGLVIVGFTIYVWLSRA
jgi:hypothetical protein